MTDKITAEWIAADWGTTHLRVWAMQGHSVLARARSDDGMGALAPEAFEPALIALVGGWLGTARVPVMACGMVGARQGWIEAPYCGVPVKPLGAPTIAAPCEDRRLQVQVIPGLKQDNPPDVMRGEETQIAGFLALNPGWDGVICLPGTHSKWVQLSAGEVVSFQTFMTGEMFALLSQQSVLRHSLDTDEMDETAFLEAISDGLSRPEKLAARLFAIRAGDLLHGLAPAVARARISGALIGAELAAARPYWLGQQLAVIGPDALARTYASALGQQGAPVTLTDADAMTLAGLTAAYRHWKDVT